MPVDDKLKTRTNVVLSRVTGEIEKIKADQLRHAECVNESTVILGRLATNDRARMNLTKFSARAVKLAEAYSANAANLRDEAALSEDLMEVNARLAALYLVVAVGKIADVVASATGVGKAVTTAKNSFLDMANTMSKKDAVMAGGQAANLTMILAGGETANMTKEFDELQKVVGAILGLIKDIKVLK